jgi:nitroreductase
MDFDFQNERGRLIMDAFEAIFTRHSVSRVRPDPLPRPLIEELLQAAVQAPNHYKIRPWRFVVLQRESRLAMGKVMAQTLKAAHADLPDSALEIEQAKPMRAPVVIAVGVDKSDDLRVLEIENVCAVAAAIENLLIAANAKGLGGMWRTGPAARDLQVKKFLGFDPDQDLLGFIYIGYPETPVIPVERPSFEDRTTWMD